MARGFENVCQIISENDRYMDDVRKLVLIILFNSASFENVCQIISEKLSRSYLQRRKMEKQRQKEPFTT